VLAILVDQLKSFLLKARLESKMRMKSNVEIRSVGVLTGIRTVSSKKSILVRSRLNEA